MNRSHVRWVHFVSVSYVIINTGGENEINHFASNQCLHRPSDEVLKGVSESRAATLPNAACKIDVKVTAYFSTSENECWCFCLHIDCKQVFQNCGRSTAKKWSGQTPDWFDQWLQACLEISLVWKLLAASCLGSCTDSLVGKAGGVVCKHVTGQMVLPKQHHPSTQSNRCKADLYLDLNPTTWMQLS